MTSRSRKFSSYEEDFVLCPKPVRKRNVTGNKTGNREKPENRQSSSRKDVYSANFEARRPGSNPPAKMKPRHPPGLKGREIGLWYSRHMEKKKQEEKVFEITLSPGCILETQNLLTEAESSDTDLAWDKKIYLDVLGKSLGGVKKRVEESFEDRINKAVHSKLANDYTLDKTLYAVLSKKKESSSNYKNMFSDRQNMPSYKMKDAIVELIKNNQVVVLFGETGCGKTTQVVQYVLDDFIMQQQGSLCSIVCTQPRRISAITVAERVAAERDEPLGENIGYQIRLECVLPKRSRGCIVFMTTGILFEHLEKNPTLSGITHLFIDEIHERNIESDFLMTLMKYILPKRRDLKVILMSATLNAKAFSNYFGGIPMIEIPGITFPVEELFLEEILLKTKFRMPRKKKKRKEPLEKTFVDYVIPYARDLEAKNLYPKWIIEQLMNPESEDLNTDLITAVVQFICTNEPEGAILVFVPGLADILKLHRDITSQRFYSHSKHIIIPMHSILPTVQQKEAFNRPPRGVRKIIIATSILETSITINDIVYVIDCGKNKILNFDVRHNVATLEPTWITMANARQRRGRAGRTQAGKCYKLYTKARQSTFESYPIPEVLTILLENVILKVKMLELGHAAAFLEKLMDPPDPEVVNLSLKILRNLNALDNEERLTTLGRHLARLPMDPHTGKMIIMAAVYSCIDPVFSIAACLSYKEPFAVPFGREEDVLEVKKVLAAGEKSDHLILSETLKHWEIAKLTGDGRSFAYENYLSDSTLRLIRDMKGQFARHLWKMNFLQSSDTKDPRSNVNSENKTLVKAILCSGLYPNVALMRNTARKSSLQTRDHQSVKFHKKSFCSEIKSFESPYFVYHRILKSSSIFLHDATMIDAMPLLLFGKKPEISDSANRNIKVDDLIKFRCGRKARNLLKKLRDYADAVIESVIEKPEQLNWEEPDVRTKILMATVELLNSKNWKLTIDIENPES